MRCIGTALERSFMALSTERLVMGDTVAQQDAAGGKTDQQHDDSQHQGTGPGQHLPGFIRAAGALVHHHRHRGHRLEDVVVPVLVAEGGCR
ncbi:hypothetical protein G6F66_015580 [Rhizopus arrhizus]|nr:hypothetical protein G6F66_015580 [Rhizopus arrhizus]